MATNDSNFSFSYLNKLVNQYNNDYHHSINKEWVNLFSVTTTVMFWYIGITALCALTTWRMRWSFPNKMSIVWLLIVLTVAFDGHQKVVRGLLRKFISTFSLVILSLLSGSSVFLFRQWICLFVGMPFLNVFKI